MGFFIFILISVILLLVMGHYLERTEEKNKESNIQNKKDINMKKNKSVGGIIDVNELELSLLIPDQELNGMCNVPKWNDFYVFRASDLFKASEKQIEFYYQFKTRFKQNELVNINKQTNYAFILFFEILEEYELHDDIKLLENQFNLLSRICLQTKKYSDASLKDLLSKRKDNIVLHRLDESKEIEYYSSNYYYDPDLYKLGKKYKEKLNLSKQETAWLNKFYLSSNVFNSIEGCLIAILKQYILILKLLNQELNKEKSSIAEEISIYREKIKDELDSFYGIQGGNYQEDYYFNRIEDSLYHGIFKRVENSVRENYGHKRKISDNLSNFEDIAEKLTHIDGLVDKVISENEHQIIKPDEETQIDLNKQNVNRWKREFKEIKDRFSPNDIDSFITEIENLESVNQKNPNIKSIFYEASKFMVKYHSAQTLIYYAKYTYYDLKSKRIDNKQLPKTMQKSLFKSDNQIKQFQEIISELLSTRDIERAIEKFRLFYIPKRKKIIIDNQEIKDVETKHSGTLELLNNILSDEEDSVGITLKESNNEISSKYNNKFKVALTKVQLQVIEMIAANSYQLTISKVEQLAIENNLFKNQLIDSINEVFAEVLDGDVLIEEENDFYVIEESFYKDIIGG